MFEKPDLPTIIVGVLLAVVVAAGVYVTYFQQTAELDRLEKAEQAAEMKRAEMEDLFAEYTQSRTQAREVMSKWSSRYKVVPDSLTSPEVVGYLNDLTQSGFETFDISIQGVEQSEAYSFYRLRATGRGYFSSLYRFIWQVENNRQFYALQDLNLNHIDLITKDKETDTESLQVMVSFNMSINAYFGGPEGVSSSGEDWRPVSEEDASRLQGRLPPVPSKVLADANPDINPFFPVIMDQLPPNSRGLVEIENARLVSIVGGEAVFKSGGELRKVGVGEDIYLGQITDIDASSGTVRAVLNRGGIIDDVEVGLGIENAYRGLTGTGDYSSSSSNRQRSGPRQNATGQRAERTNGAEARRGSQAARGGNSQGRMSRGRMSQGRTSGQR